VSVKITLHPALQRTYMPISEAIDKPGTICPVRIIGRPGMLMSHMCVECTISPSGRLMVRWSSAGWMLDMGVPAIMKMDVAPVLAMACVSVNVSTLGTPFWRAEAMSLVRDLFNVITVASLLLFPLILLGSEALVKISWLHL
jgi:hypothetical protein